MKIESISGLTYKDWIRNVLDKEESASRLSFLLNIRLANYSRYHHDIKIKNERRRK